jgi:hypothetical protein
VQEKLQDLRMGGKKKKRKEKDSPVCSKAATCGLECSCYDTEREQLLQIRNKQLFCNCTVATASRWRDSNCEKT